MKPEIKKKWIAALLSGDYEQGQHQLRDGDAFCCMGVLCDLHSRTEQGGQWNDKGWYMNRGGTLPEQVVVWAGLLESDPIAGGSALSGLNDRGFNFKFIADRIEKYL